MTAGAAQAGRVPGIKDLTLTHGQKEGTDVRPAVWAESRCPLHGDDAAPSHPVRLMTAARKRPAPRQPEASWYRDGRALGEIGAGDDGVWAVAVHLPQGRRREVRRHDRGARRNHHVPTNGAILPRQFLDHLHYSLFLDLGTAHCFGHRHLEDTRVAECLEEWARHVALLFAGVAPLLNDRG